MALSWGEVVAHSQGHLPRWGHPGQRRTRCSSNREDWKPPQQHPGGWDQDLGTGQDYWDRLWWKGVEEGREEEVRRDITHFNLISR